MAFIDQENNQMIMICLVKWNERQAAEHGHYCVNTEINSDPKWMRFGLGNERVLVLCKCYLKHHLIGNNLDFLIPTNELIGVLFYRDKFLRRKWTRGKSCEGIFMKQKDLISRKFNSRWSQPLSSFRNPPTANRLGSSFLGRYFVSDSSSDREGANKKINARHNQEIC